MSLTMQVVNNNMKTTILLRQAEEKRRASGEAADSVRRNLAEPGKGLRRAFARAYREG